MIKIIAVNGEKVDRFKDITSPLNLMGSDITVLRNGKEVILSIPDTFYKEYSKSKGLFIEPDNFSFSIDSVKKNSFAAKAGLRGGDKIVLADNQAIQSLGDFKARAYAHAGESMDIVILRQMDSLKVSVEVDSLGQLGF